MTTQAILDALKALKANHEWHIFHDDYDGYPESDLCEQNLKVIAALSDQSQAEPKARRLTPEQLADPVYVQSYIDECHASFEVLLASPQPSRNEVLISALNDFRNKVLHQRGLLAENGMTSEQVNDVLNEFDAAFPDLKGSI
jgi:hypothetical protein